MQHTHKLSKRTISLHWIVAALAFTLLTLGIYMTNIQAYNLYTLHISLGVLFLAFAATRILWRIREGFPKSLGTLSNNHRKAAKLVHLTLLILTLVLPVSGIFMSYLAGYGVHFFGWTLLPVNLNPTTHEPTALNEQWVTFFTIAHRIGAYAMIGLILLHAGAAFKHHFLDKDTTLLRMLPIREPDTPQ